MSFSDITQQLTLAVAALKANALKSITLVMWLWAIHLVNTLFGMRLNLLGLRPRRLSGFIGVITSPFLHGNFNHLFFNSIPLFILIDFMFAVTGQSFSLISGAIVIISGLATWVCGRRGLHVGASSLVMGYWGFLLAIAFYQPSIIHIILGVIMLYYLGGLALNLLPTAARVSVEGHIFGAIAGVFVAIMWARHY
jgi:membrane associated rhomboid family serine protease